MENRTVGIVATIAAAAICGCAGLLALVFGVLGALQVPFQTTVNGVEGSAPMPPTIGYVLLCLAILFFAVPVAVGFLALRTKPKPASTGEAVPPPS
jgi:hypothetical protein